jgi:hypothetical protein
LLPRRQLARRVKSISPHPELPGTPNG